MSYGREISRKIAVVYADPLMHLALRTNHVRVVPLIRPPFEVSLKSSPLLSFVISLSSHVN